MAIFRRAENNLAPHIRIKRKEEEEEEKEEEEEEEEEESKCYAMNTHDHISSIGEGATHRFAFLAILKSFPCLLPPPQSF